MARTVRNLVGCRSFRTIGTESTRRAEAGAADALAEAGFLPSNRHRSRATGTAIPNSWDDLPVAAWSEVHKSKLPAR